MTMPGDGEGSYSLLGQILAKQGEMGGQISSLDRNVAVMAEQLKDIPEYEKRLRKVELDQAQSSGGRDTWARVLAGLATAGAIAAAWASLMHH